MPHYRIPKSLKNKEWRDAINTGLYYLALGYRPDNKADAEEERVSQRVPVNERGVQSLQTLMELGEWNDEREVIADALAWIKEQPEHVQRARVA